MAKKVATKKTEAASAAVEKKTEAAVKTTAAKPVTENAAVSETPATVETAVETAPAKKEAAPAEPAAEKAPAKKAPAKKTASQKEAVPSMPHPEVFVQFYGKEASVREVIENIRKAWTEETGKDASEMKDLKIYIKPEESVAYYVINEETRSIAL